MNTVSRILSNTLCDPSQGPNLLLFQPKIAVKYSVIELLQECLLVQVDFLDEEPVFEFADGLGLITAEREFSEEVRCAFCSSSGAVAVLSGGGA